MRKCSKCKETKTKSEFYKHKNGREGIRAECGNCTDIQSKKYREANRARVLAKKKEWRDKNKEYTKTYKKRKRASLNATEAKRRACKLEATPKWLSSEQFKEIEYFYKRAKFKCWDNKMHVDHIIPLVSKKVCGLHVPWNLQVISAKDNQSKNNKLLEV